MSDAAADQRDEPDEPGVPRETQEPPELAMVTFEQFLHMGASGAYSFYQSACKLLGAEYARRLTVEEQVVYLAEKSRALERRVKDLEFQVAVRDTEIRALDADRKRITGRADDESARLAAIKRIIEAPPKTLVHSPSMEEAARETREAAPHPYDGYDRWGEMAGDLERRLREAEKH